MNGLDKNENLDFLLGKEVSQIAIGNFEVTLNFDKGVSIQIFSSFVSKDKGGKILKSQGDQPQETKNLVYLLGKKIKNFQNPGTGELELEFSSGDFLTVLDDNENYESYTITSKDGTIAV